jgi:DNA-directed RNA polymerase specialized sigma24 family protein
MNQRAQELHLDDVPDEPLPWLLAVARRVLATQHRSAQRRNALHEKLIRTIPSTSENDPVASLVSGPVTDALAHMRRTEREAITLLAWDGLTPKQAAAALGQTRLAFRLRLHRAKRKLRSELERRHGGAAELERATEDQQPGHPITNPSNLRTEQR